MINTKKLQKKIGIMALTVAGLLLAGGITYAAFMDTGSVLGSSFSVASSDIKLLSDVAGTLDSANLVDELPGPSFERITPYWQQDYLIKIYNNATESLDINSSAYYETADDPAELRQLIFVEPIEWDDVNMNGLLDSGEATYSYGRKTIVKWKTEGFSLGTVDEGNIKGLILRFSTDAVADTKQGTTALFDFEFSATPQE